MQPAADVGADVADAAEDAAPDAVADAAPDAPDDADEDADTGEPTAEYEAKVLIEHNAADDDTGFQIFFDWDPWSSLTVKGPSGDVLSADAQDELADFGLTEMFLETNEPEAAETPLDDVLAIFPEGAYDFAAQAVEGMTMLGVGTLSHAIPEATDIVAPAEDAEVDPTAPLQVDWTDVTDSLQGNPIDVIAYQLIVVEEADVPPQPGFFTPELSVHVPADTTNVTVPAEFLQPGVEYEIEVLAIADNGNQTISLITFQTQ